MAWISYSTSGCDFLRDASTISAWMMANADLRVPMFTFWVVRPASEAFLLLVMSIEGDFSETLVVGSRGVREEVESFCS